VEAYKQKLKDIAVQELSKIDCKTEGIDDLFVNIGKALMKELTC
jgi:hypothetical protein